MTVERGTGVINAIVFTMSDTPRRPRGGRSGRKPGLTQGNIMKCSAAPFFLLGFLVVVLWMGEGGEGGGYGRSHECCFVCRNAKL